VGGKLPKVSDSSSTESILYFSVFSAIIGFAISCAVLQIAYRIKIRYHANSISIRESFHTHREQQNRVPCQEKATSTPKTGSANQSREEEEGEDPKEQLKSM
jgi:heme-binding NEAT domain protein